MGRVEEQTSQLIEAIRQSREYMQYQSSYDQIEEDEELKKQLNQFRRRQFQIQLLEGDPVSSAQALEEEFKEMLARPLVKNFLLAEQHYCKMVRNMNDQLAESLDFDINFLEEA